jgi:hypothetical protein
VALVLLPAWLIASGAIAIVLYFQNQSKQGARLDHAFSRMVSAQSIADDVEKLTRVIGERHDGSESAARALTQAARMIEGALGPSNVGLEIRKVAGPSAWPILTSTIPGAHPDQAPIWLVTSYDSRPGSMGVQANATGVASLMAVAQALVSSPLARPIQIAFLPHANAPDSPVLDTAARLGALAKDAHLILCIEAMAANDSLWLTSRDTESPALPHLAGLGEVKGADVTCLNEDSDLASLLYESGLPAVRISTCAQLTKENPDHQPIRPETLAASTGRLVTFVQRIAGIVVR